MLTIPINIFKKRGSKRREHRLYIAYYHRTPTPNNPVRYHTALVAIPTPATGTDMEGASECESPSSSVPPSPSSPTFQSPLFTLPSTNSPSTPASNLTAPNTAAKKAKATKFHVVNVPVNENGRGRVVWQQRVESDYLDVPGPFCNLRSRLACLMFVGHVSSVNKVERTLKKVQVNKYADEFPDYLCTTWMDEALAVLVNEKVIDPLPASPAEFWEVGAQYADRWKEGYGPHAVEIDEQIPCCDRDGNRFPTPLGPVNVSG